MKVLDASVVVKMLLEEEGSEKVRKMLQGKEKMAVPDLVFLEVANTLVTKSNFPKDRIEEGLGFIYELGLQIYPLERKILIEAALEAKAAGTAVYDMAYATLAKSLRAELLTSDRKFASRVGWKWVKVI